MTKAFLCPNCRKLISGDETVCPYCGLKGPGTRRSRWLESGALNPVQAIIYTNIVFYILALFIDPSALRFSPGPMTLLSPSEGSLFLLGATGSIPIAGFGRWWTLVTASFLHAGLLHIFFNMAALAQLGPFVRREFGVYRFLVLYTLTGICGFFLSLLAGIPFTIGASASICGLIGAILYYGKSRGGFYGQMIYKQAMGWVMGLAIFGLLIPGINNWAHGGGLLSGIALAFVLGYQERKPETALQRALALLCIAATAVLLFYGALQALLMRLHGS